LATRKQKVEEYERDILLPLAQQRLEIDLDEAGRSGLEGLGSLFEEFGEPTEMRPLCQEEEAAPETPAANGQPSDASGNDSDQADAESPAGEDPDFLPEPILARPVPLVISVEREGKSWLLQSEERNIALTLDSLRCLRQVPGAEELRLRTILPAPVERKKRFMGRG